jgi:hypothetical protein
MTLRMVALLVLASLVACTGSTETPKPSPSPTAISSPTAPPTPVPSPTLSPSGTFVAVGDMTHPRSGATATLLTDGKVLIAGGYDLIYREVMLAGVTQHLASAELYDPVTRTFTPTGSMKAARSYAGAVLLRDGRVLIVGGEGCKVPARCKENHWGGSVALNSAEIYDPTTGRFAPTGSMIERHDAPMVTLLPDGRVLVFEAGDSLVEVYDPTTGRFSRDGTLSNHYADVDVALLPNGKVFVVGDNLPGLGAELFDPGTGRSSSIPIYPSGAQVLEAVLLTDGRVLIWAYDSNPDASYMYTYDPGTGAFVNAAPFDGPAGWMPEGGLLQRDGRILLLGLVYTQNGAGGLGWTDLVGLYDPGSGLHMLDSKPVEARTLAMMTTLPDGSVLIAGGERLSQIFSSAELFIP